MFVRGARLCLPRSATGRWPSGWTRDCLHNVMTRRGIEGILTNVDRCEATNTKLTALWINQRLYLPLAEVCGYPTVQRPGKIIPSRSHKRSNRRRKHQKENTTAEGDSDCLSMARHAATSGSRPAAITVTPCRGSPRARCPPCDNRHHANDNERRQKAQPHRHQHGCLQFSGFAFHSVMRLTPQSIHRRFHAWQWR